MSDEFKNISWPGWETVRLIGRGSFGAVYEIERKVFDETEKAALKVISIPQNSGDIDDMYSDGYDEESITSTFKSHLQSIVAEYSLMRKMNGSANIVNCDDVRYIQHDDGIGWDIFIKMELLTPLTKALPSGVDEESVIKVAKDMCGALELCKKYGIVHRDIKPQNIFVSEHGDYKLGDFGVAKTVEKTMGGTKIGTYKYMAPEVYNNQPYGSAADIYSLGLVVYWLLNERRMPFMPLPPEKLKAGMEDSSRHRRLSGEKLPEPAHGSAELKRIVLKACAYDTQERYSSAALMLEDLNKLTGGTFVIPTNMISNIKDKEQQEDNNATEPVFADDSASTITTAVEEKKFEPNSVQVPLSSNEEQKRNAPKYILVGFGIVLAIIMFLMLRSCVGENPGTKFSKTDGTSVTPEQLEWSDWTDELPENVAADKYEIEEKTLYSSRTQETTSSTEHSSMEGWELYDTIEANGGFGEWSKWSETEAESSATREVSTQNRYRYRNISYSTEYSDWGTWSSWQDSAVSKTDLLDVETRTVYHYFYFICNNNTCGRRSPASNCCYSWAGGCGGLSCGSYTSVLSTIPYSSATNFGVPEIFYITVDGNKLFAYIYSYSQHYRAPITQYRYRTRSTQQVPNYGAWSKWSETEVSPTKDIQVESTLFYSYRDLITTTTYIFRRWTDWSEYSDTLVTPTETIEVQTKIQYRYRPK